MVNYTPCSECKDVDQRIPEADAQDSLEKFKAYYCNFYKETVHDYYAECIHFQSSEKEPTK